MTAEPSEEPPPATIGKYEPLHEIARGGMAVLYLAREVGIEGFEKVVVVKRILPELASRREYLDMFLDEARIAASLQHPNLPHVYELGRDGGEYFFAMEYLHGADVRRFVKTLAVRRRELPLEHAISIMLGLCAGLHYAHEKGLVHRDVSPKNVFVTYDGGVKLIDFGIVQAENKRSETSTGTVKGTVQYLSPEQVLAGDFDRRTDVFAASILLWELTTGRSLYTGAADYQIMTRIVEADAPAPSTVQPEYPPELEAIVMKGLAREPAGRFATAEELQLALEEFARTHQLPTSTIGLARFMREIFVEDVAAYESAKERGKLATRALAEITTTDKLRAPSESPAQAAAGEPQPKATRKLAPRERRRRWPWLAAALVVVGLASGGWYLWRSDTPASSDAVAQPAPAQPDPPKEVIVPAAAAGSAAPAPAPAPVTPHAHRDRKSAVTPAAKPTKPKPLTSRDLDAVLPPKP